MKSAEEWAEKIQDSVYDVEFAEQIVHQIRREAYEDAAKIVEGGTLASDWSDGVLRGNRMTVNHNAMSILARATEVCDAKEKA